MDIPKDNEPVKDPDNHPSKHPDKQADMRRYHEAVLRVSVHSQKRTLTHIRYRSTYRGVPINEETELAPGNLQVLPGYIDSHCLYTLDTPPPGSYRSSLDRDIQQVGSRLRMLEGSGSRAGSEQDFRSGGAGGNLERGWDRGAVAMDTGGDGNGGSGDVDSEFIEGLKK